MGFRVAFDLDGTLADMAAALRVERERLFGGDDPAAAHDDDPALPAPRSANSVDRGLSRLTLTEQQRARLWRHVEQMPDFWAGLAETETGIVARLHTVATTRRWDVVFLTTRPTVAGATTQRQSQQWLETHGFQWPSVLVVQRSRGRIADALGLDAVVDDRPENCLDVALESKAQAILIRSSLERQAPRTTDGVGVRVVGSAQEALTLLEKLDDSRSGSRVGRRLRRLFGADP